MLDNSHARIQERKKSKITYQQRVFGLIFISLISLTQFRCANMQRPTGGPKDSIAPKLLNISPENFKHNFKDKEIVLEFDEYIKFNNQFKEFSISPDLDKQPDYKIKKKTLHIKLPDSLEANTTYTINFGKGLVDYNEGNPFINYNYVFATGNELDSLSIAGSVKNAYTKTFEFEKDKEVRVLLIPTRQDYIFGKKKANIFTTIDSTGQFKFNNLRADTYRIYAIKEQNNDRIYNNPDELLGFLQDSIVLDKNLDGIKIEYSKGLPQKFRTLEKKLDKTGKISLIFNQPLNTPTLSIIDPLDLNDKSSIQFSQNNDSAKVYLEKLDFDSIKFQLKDDNNILDTILLRKNKSDKIEKIIEPKFNISNKVDKIKHLTITSEFPIKDIDKNKLILNEDSISRRNFQLQKDSINQNIYHVRFNWKAKKNYELVIQENAISSLYADGNKESKISFTLDEADNYGDIKFNLSGLDTATQYIVELIDEKKETIYDRRVINGKNEIIYSKFPGGKYTLRIIKDLNKNARWDGANYYTKQQAEPIWYLDKTFTIRSNWEQTEKLEIKFD